MTDHYFWLISIGAVFIVSLAKSGLVSGIGLVGVPMLALVMPPREAAGIMLPLLLIMDVFALYAYRHDMHLGILKIMVPGALVGIGVGWTLSSMVSDDMVLLGIGVISLIFILDAVLPLRKKLQGLPPSKAWGRVWGALAGFTSFVSHTGGPPFQIFVLPQKLTPANYAGTTAWFFAVVNVVKLVPYFFLGQLSFANLSTSLTLAPIAILGMVLGIFLVRRISAVLFYKIAYAMIFILSVKLIFDGVSGLLAA